MPQIVFTILKNKTKLVIYFKNDFSSLFVDRPIILICVKLVGMRSVGLVFKI